MRRTNARRYIKGFNMNSTPRRKSIFSEYHDVKPIVDWFQSDIECSWPRWLIEYFVEVPFVVGQARVQMTREGVIEWVVLWAFVGDEIHKDLCNGKSKVLHISEWNEGCHLWLLPIYQKGQRAPCGLVRQLLSLRNKFGPANLMTDGGPLQLGSKIKHRLEG